MTFDNSLKNNNNSLYVSNVNRESKIHCTYVVSSVVSVQYSLSSKYLLHVPCLARRAAYDRMLLLSDILSEAGGMFR